MAPLWLTALWVKCGEQMSHTLVCEICDTLTLWSGYFLQSYMFVVDGCTSRLFLYFDLSYSISKQGKAAQKKKKIANSV